MKNLPAYAREYRDDFLLCLLNNTKFKKKDLLKAMSTKTYDAFLKAMELKAVGNKCYSKLKPLLDMAGESIYYTYRFKDSMHFYAEGVPKDYFKDVSLFDRDNRDDMIVDFRYKGNDFFAYSFEDQMPIKLEGKDWLFDYAIDVYGKLPEMLEYNSKYVLPEFSLLKNRLPIYRIYVSTKNNVHTIEFHKLNEYMINNFECFVVGARSETVEDKIVTIKNDSIEAFGKLGIPDPIYVLNTLQYCLHCYDNRVNLTRKNGKVTKHYNTHKVHIHTKSIKDSDKYVSLPLHVYAKEHEPYIRSEYKGGHHASPTPHERRGHFRLAKKSGDYNYIDGEYVYVGKGNGKYTYVRSSKVGYNKDGDKVTIYRVK